MYFAKTLVGLNLELANHHSADLFPEESLRLFERAVEIAAAQRGTLRLCAVVDGLDLSQIPATPQQVSYFSQILSDRLDSLVEQASEAGVACDAVLLGGVAWVELLREADEFHPDLILVGAGRSAARLGVTPLKLLRFAKAAVLIERFRPTSAADTLIDTPSSTGPALPTRTNDDEPEPLHVLIADDLSDDGQRALQVFVGSSLWRDAKCWLIHVAENDRWPEAWRTALSDEQNSQRRADLIEVARQQLHRHLSPTDHRTMTYGILPEVVEGSPDKTLLRLVSERQIDLLVCGTTTRRDKQGFAFGQTAETILPHIGCSILAFPPTKSSEGCES